ncbi:MAG TPA: VOC family protein [Flavobacteriaceae bacterium]|nr:VOC family protein [Flavobacteriaceae bacterium]
MRFAHTNIVSTDWEKLAEFYIKTFSCKIVPPIRRQSGKWFEDGTGLKDAKLEGAHLLLPGHGESGPTLEIYQYENIENEEPILPNKRGFGHIAFEVEDVKATLQKLVENGGRRFGEITKKEIIGAGEITFVYARDPEGNLIELQSWEKLAGR